MKNWDICHELINSRAIIKREFSNEQIRVKHDEYASFYFVTNLSG